MHTPKETTQNSQETDSGYTSVVFIPTLYNHKTNHFSPFPSVQDINSPLSQLPNSYLSNPLFGVNFPQDTPVSESNMEDTPTPSFPKKKKSHKAYLPQEDAIIIKWAKRFKSSKGWFSEAAKEINQTFYEGRPIRNPGGIRARWTWYIDPVIEGKRYIETSWTGEDDSKLLKLYFTYGNNWETISRELPGRDPRAIRTRWKTLSKIGETTREAPQGQLEITNFLNMQTQLSQDPTNKL